MAIPRVWRRRLLLGVPVVGLAGLAAWSWAVGAKGLGALALGVALALASAFAPSVRDAWQARWALRDSRRRELDALLVRDLPRSVAGLLRPEAEVIGFFGRGWELRRLETWCRDREASPVRLVVAPGGVGKTRLVRRFAVALSDWKVWPVQLGGEAETAARIDDGVIVGRLLVIDYAESRDPAGLARLLCAAACCATGGVRVLLLARAVGPWWSSLSA